MYGMEQSCTVWAYCLWKMRHWCCVIWLLRPALWKRPKPWPEDSIAFRLH